MNDLDLLVFDPTGARRFPWTLNPASPATPATCSAEDHVNVVEQVFADSGMISGTWTVQVVGHNVPMLSPQKYTLAYGDNATNGNLYVVSTSPASGMPNVPTNANVTVAFNKAMNVATLNSTNVSVTGSLSGAHAWTSSYNGGNYTLSIDPTVDFTPGELVTVTVGTGVESQRGDHLSANCAFSFSVTSAHLPVVRVGGTLVPNTAWTAGKVCLLTNDVTVNAGATLTIEAGVVVKFQARNSWQDNLWLDVAGTLNLQGTAGQPVVFASSRDGEYGGVTSGDGQGPQPYDWGYLRFSNPANVLHDAIVRYGRYQQNSSGSLVWVSGSLGGTMEVRDCTVERSYGDGLRLDGGTSANVVNTAFNSIGDDGVEANSGLLSVDYCTFTEYGKAGVHITGSATATVIHCDFVDAARDYGIRNDTTTTAVGTLNWWGSASGPSTVGPGTGAKVSAFVNYSPWSTSFNSGPAPSGPRIVSTPNPSVVVGQPYHYDGDDRPTATGTGPFTWSKLYGPDTLSIDSATGLIAWTPQTIGSYAIGIRVQDGSGADSQYFTVQVNSTGDSTPPNVTSFNFTLSGPASSPTAQLNAAFSEPVLLNSGNITILNASGQSVPFSGYSYSVGNNTLGVTVPSLPAGQTYRLVLTDTITDQAFNPLDGEFDGHTSPTGNGVAGGAFVASFTVTGGTNATPARFESIMRLPDERIQLLLSGGIGQVYRLEASTNFTSWEALTTLTNTVGTMQFTDTNATGFSRRFYRAAAE